MILNNTKGGIIVTSNSTKKRFAAVTARLFVLLIAACLLIAVAPRLTDGFLPTAQAAESYQVPSGAAASAISTKLATYSSGTTVNVLLSGDVDLDASIVIPSGVTVNFYMNGKTMSKSESYYQAGSFYAFTNNQNATLNIYSGSPSQPALTNGNSTISLSNDRLDMSRTDGHNEQAFTDYGGVQNAGTVTVNKGVKINVFVRLEYGTGGSNENNTNINLGATGVWNTTNAASCTLNAAEITCYTRGRCANANHLLHTNRPGSNRSLSYGVYGGIVTVNGDSKISVEAQTSGIEGKSGSDEGSAKTTGVAFGVCSSQKITVKGGTFSYSAHVDGANDGMKNATSHYYMGGICYSSVIPDMYDGTINAFESSVKTEDDDMKNISLSVYEANVGKMPTLPVSGHTVATEQTYRNEGYDYNITGAVAGQFYDETGNTYDGASSTTDGSHPASIIHGAENGKYRVHVVYRYWTDNNKTAVDTSVVGTDGYVGYSYKPLGDSTNIVSTVLQLNGLSSNKLIKTGGSGISYHSGGASKNDYYWKQFNIAYASTSNWFSDYDVASIRGTVFKNFVDGTSGSVPASASPVYIFMDYYRAAPTEIVASVGAGNSATVTYTGDPIKASALNLKIKDAVYSTDFTSEYNIDFNAASKIPVTFAWSGTTAAGTAVSGNGELPTDAGTYSVTLSIADSSAYDPNDCDPVRHKNRLALDFTFILTIEQASVTRGSLPENVTLTYGTKLNEALSLTEYAALGKNESPNGRFSFTNSNDGTSYKTVGEGTTSITWTPVYAAGVTVKNYKETTFTVAYTVNKASIVISPKAAQVTYGETDFSTPYDIAVSGLVANDNNAIGDIAAAIDYMVFVNGSYIYYTPDDVSVGTYDIRARVKQAEAPDVLNNYTYSYADLESGYEVNKLTVAKRGLTVKATAVSRAYIPDLYTVNVIYEVVGGRYSADDVRFTTGTGNIANCGAGTRQVGGVTKSTAAECMTGGKASCYQVAELVYDTGDTFTVEITKATPTVNPPVVNEMFYQRGRKLNDIPLTGTDTSVDGSWSWVAPSTNPTVAVSTYQARFTPTDNSNYDVKDVDVSITVKPTPVKISYNGTVEYGDPFPNITAYSYTAELDPTFSSDGLETTGNITPSTTYREGSAVSAEGYPVIITLANYADAAGNYTFTAQNGKIVVTPRNIEFTVPNATIEYGENFVPTQANSAVTFNASRLVGEDTINSITDNGTEPTWNYNTAYDYQTNYQVGTYAINATPTFTTSSNYTVSVVPGALTVTKASLTIRANNITLPYNSDVPADLATAYTLEGKKRNEGIDAIVTSGSITVSTNYEKGSPVNASGYDVSVSVGAATIPNYNVTVVNGKINVVKATPVISAYPTASIVYGQTLADAVFTGAVVDDDVPGTFAYNAATTKPAYSSEPYNNYTAAFIPTDTNNYNTVTGLAISLTVNKMPVTGALSVTGLPMVGETLTVDVSGMNPDTVGAYTFTWVMNGSTVGTGETLTLTEANKGNAITVTAVAQGYYEGQRSYTVTAIAPVLPSVATILNATGYAGYFELDGLEVFGGTTALTYDAGQHSVTLTQKTGTLGSTVVGGITVKYNGSAEIPVNAGLYTVSVDVATPDLSRVNDPGVTTYSPATGLVIGTLKIDKAPYHVTVTVADKIYDGYNTATAANIDESGAMTVAGATDDVSFDAARAVYTFDGADVGENKTVSYGNAALTGSAAANYELNFTLGNDARASITKRTLEVTIIPVERAYEKNYYAVDLNFNVNADTIAPADTSADVYVNGALATGTVEDYHAGTQRVNVSRVELAGSKAGNYELHLTNAADLTVKIGKATPIYPIPNAGTVFYNSGRTLSNISLGNSRWAWAAADANTVPTAGRHTYTAVYTPEDTDNYASVSREVELVVEKAPVQIKAASFSIIYGDYAPTYYYTVTGLTGADTIRDMGGYVILSCAYQPGSSESSDVGQYDIVLSGGFSSANYEFTYEGGTINVNPRPAYVTAIAQSRPYEAGNTSVNITFSELSNLYPGDASNVYLTGTQPVVGTIADANAGLKVVTYAQPGLDGSKAGNYTLTFLNPELKVEITKAILDGVVLPTSGTVYYGAKLNTTVFTSTYSGEELGTFSMENPMSTPAAVGTTSNVYKVVFTPTNTQNYATISDYITLTVYTADLNVELIMSGSAEVGKKLYVATNNLPADAYDYIEFRWYRLNNRTDDVRDGTLVASDTTEYTVTERDADQYIACVAVCKPNSPYNIDGRTGTESSVKKQSLSIWERILKWFYKVIASITQLFGRI